VKSKLTLIAAGLLGIVALGLLYSQKLPHRAESPTIPAQITHQSAAEDPAPSTRAPATEVADEQEARLAFHARARKFFAEAPALSASERVSQARTIEADVNRYESQGELSAGEALLLKVALIRESVSDPTLQAQQIAELERTYRLDTEQRQAAWAAQRDPMFELYKLRETAIVTNVMAMNEIPGGLSRDEYLRRQLQAERELLLENGSH
jgi:hypothetical protein